MTNCLEKDKTSFPIDFLLGLSQKKNGHTKSGMEVFDEIS